MSTLTEKDIDFKKRLTEELFPNHGSENYSRSFSLPELNYPIMVEVRVCFCKEMPDLASGALSHTK